MAAATRNESWKNFPRYMIAAMLVVIAVNVRFIYIAVSTFPGAASSDDFDTSNRYDSILNAVAAQDKLGWTSVADTAGAVPFIGLTGADRQPLTGALINAEAERPLGNDPALQLAFSETAPGHYTAASALPLHGQWDLKLRITQSGHSVRVTRRIVIK
jgi:nitrogen fixation protein FixH